MPQGQSLVKQNDLAPNCHSAFFRGGKTPQFIQIESSRSFQKSAQKKLKLIKEHKSLQKSIKQKFVKRTIKPLRLKLTSNKQQQSTTRTLCSIKQFKTKINKITQESKTKNDPNLKTQTEPKSKTQNNQVGQSYQESFKSRFRTEQDRRFHTASIYQTVSSHSPQSIATLNNSLVVKQGSFNLQSLLQSYQSYLQTSSTQRYRSPQNQQEENVNHKFQTPNKQKIQTKLKELSTSYKTRKKQKLTLNMARKVETNQTHKTQNQANYSFIQDMEYENILNKISYPDYFSPKRIHPIKKCSLTVKTFKLCLNVLNSAATCDQNLKCLGQKVYLAYFTVSFLYFFIFQVNDSKIMNYTVIIINH